MQFLFQCDLNPPEDLETALSEFWHYQQPEEDDRSPARPSVPKPPEEETAAAPAPLNAHQAALRLFSETLIRGVLENRDAIDAEIQKLAQTRGVGLMPGKEMNLSGTDRELASFHI